MKKWRILYDEIEPGADLHFTVRLDPGRLLAYVERAAGNRKKTVEVGNGLLEVRIIPRGELNNGERKPMPELPKEIHGAGEVLPTLRGGPSDNSELRTFTSRKPGKIRNKTDRGKTN